MLLWRLTSIVLKIEAQGRLYSASAVSSCVEAKERSWFDARRHARNRYRAAVEGGAIEEAGEGGNWALLPPFPILPELPTTPSADQPVVGHYQTTRLPLAHWTRHGRPP